MQRRATIAVVTLFFGSSMIVGAAFAEESTTSAAIPSDTQRLGPNVARLARELGVALDGRAALDPRAGVSRLLRPLDETVSRMDFGPEDLMMELVLRNFVAELHGFVAARGPWNESVAAATNGGPPIDRVAMALNGVRSILNERSARGRVHAQSGGTAFAKAGTGSISGTVTREGTLTPLEGIDVWVYDASGDWVGTATTDASGNYSVSGLGTGTYFALTYKASDYYIDELYMDTVCFNPWSCLVTAGAPISVTDALETAGIDFRLEFGGYVTGNVVDEGTWLGLVTGTAVTAVDQFGVIASQGMAGTPNGKYFVYGLPTGDYFLLAASTGYVAEAHDDIPIVGWVSEAFAGTTVRVTQGSPAPVVHFYLAPAGSIEGTVAEHGTGTPIPNAMIQVFDADGVMIPRFGLLSDGTGAFTVGEMPGGNYYATCTANTYIPELWENEVCVGCDVTTGTAIAVTQPSTTTGVGFELDKGGRILGTVTLEGSPSTKIENAIVTVYDDSWSPLDMGMSVADGTYATYGGLPTGSYTVTASGGSGEYIPEVYDNTQCFPCWAPIGTPVLVTAPADKTGIDFSLAPGGSVEGTVTVEGSGEPLKLAAVYLYDSGGNLVASEGSSEGDYAAGGLPTGTYFATAQGAAGGVGLQSELFDDILCPFGSCDVLVGSSISVTSGSTTSNVDFDLPLGGRIAGRVTDASTGIPLVRVSVDVFDAGGAFVVTATSGNYGLYHTEGLADGTYYALAEDNSGAGYLSELFDGTSCDGCDVTTGTAIVISSTDTYQGIDFSLAPPGTVIHLDLTSVGPVSGSETFEASETITAGGTFGVQSPGDVVLRAGEKVILTNGFFVESGATLTIEIDAGL